MSSDEFEAFIAGAILSAWVIFIISVIAGCE